MEFFQNQVFLFCLSPHHTSVCCLILNVEPLSVCLDCLCLRKGTTANCHLPVWISELHALFIAVQNQNKDNVVLVCSKLYFVLLGVTDLTYNFMKISLRIELVVR